jgi:hypothetical protein
VGREHRSGRRPQRTAIVSLDVTPPANGTILARDERGPVMPRCFPAASGWSSAGQRSKAPLEDSRGREKVGVEGAVRVRDGHAVTVTARSRNTSGGVPLGSRLLEAVNGANPEGDLDLITDNLARHQSPPVVDWREAHPRVHHVFLPTGACWLHLQEGGWRGVPFGSRREAFAGPTFADAAEIDQVTILVTATLNHRAKPWIWGRPCRKHRRRRRRLVYCL